MTQQFLVLQHIDVEHPGIFRDFMREEGVRADCASHMPDFNHLARLLWDNWRRTAVVP